MDIYKTTLYNGSTDDIITNGYSLTITDNSNYTGYSDTAQGGGSTYITLSDSESSWNDFFVGAEVQITDGTGAGQKGVITGYDGSTKRADVNVTFSPTPDSTSVYSIGEAGHLKSYFTDYRKIFVVNPSGTVGTIDGALPYNSTLPILDNYDVPDGDGVYEVILASVPTWDSGVAYKNITKPYVYYNGGLYKNIADSTNDIPSSSPTKWTVIADYSQLSDKYLYSGKISVYCGVLSCFLSNEYITMNKMDFYGCNTDYLLHDNIVLKTMKLRLMIDTIKDLSAVGDFDSVSHVINLAKQMCCGCK